MLLRLFLQLVSGRLLVYAQSSPLPGYIPLAVKTPYLQGWIGSNEGKSPASMWPASVSNNRQFGWDGLIRIDNQAYQWIGNHPNIILCSTVTSEITPTKSIFRLEAGPVQFNVTFLSPIEPDDYTRQSIPFTYLYIDAIAANDSKPHTVQIYSDVSAQWVSKEDEAIVEWNTTVVNNIIYHRFARRDLVFMKEVDGIAQDAIGYYTTPQRPGITWQTDSDIVCRANFAKNGTLPNTGDTKFRAVNDSWPVFSYSVDLGTISPGDHPDPVVWSLGLVRDPLIVFRTGQLVQNRTAYYWSNYRSIEEVMTAFLGDFPNALSRSLNLDNKVLLAAPTPEYASILSLVTRQIFASMDITIPSARPGQFNTTDIKVFMKDIGWTLRTNPVEGLYGALPALIFFNSTLARDLLRPLLEFQNSPSYPNPYAASDLGNSYPLVHDNATNIPALAIENCGNMLIMAHAQAAKSGDGTLISHYYPLLQRWADFLITNSLHPLTFVAADGANNPDMSNLALKGILGIYSMAKITEALGGSNTTYMDQATSLIKSWKQLAIAEDGHIQAVYGQTDSWSLMYNMFPAVWLETGLIEDATLEHQAQSYMQLNSPAFGLSLDNARPEAAFPHWTLMTAATIPNSSVAIRNSLISSTYRRAFKPDDISPLPVTYNPSSGDATLGNGSPFLGAAFAVAALNIHNIDIKGPQLTSSNSSGSSGSSIFQKKNMVGAIVGGVLGGLAILLLVVTGIFLFRRRRSWHQGRIAIPDEDPLSIKPFTTVENNNVHNSTHQVPQGQQTLGGPNLPRPLKAVNPHLYSTTPPNGATAIPLVPVTMPRKRREAISAPAARVYLRDELAVSPPSPSTVSMSGTEEDLRAEFEQLRRDMASIRYVTDAPPGYNPPHIL